ncbi:MAG: FHA domain-containing protein, partial [Bacteroidales bacterium]|nr:FHA domain-containing protein [Bacteroidales bacterium]
PQASAPALGGPALDGHSQAPQASAPALGGPALDGHSQAPQASAAALGGPALDGQQQPAPQPAPQQPRQEGSPAVSQGQQSAPKPQQPKLGLQEDGTYRLQCASCGQLLVVPKVKPGINRLTCPKCKNPNQFEIQPSEEDLLKCQCCGAPLTKPAADGLYSVECDQCQQPYNMIVQGGRVTKISARTKPGGTADRGSLTPMVLSTGGFFKKTTYILYKGTHFIGRWDENENSDFALKDNTVSRRSVRVDVNQSGNGLVYKMTILKATNPIYHNKKQLVEGDIVYLNYGDVLQLGNTTIKVQKQ